ncbi:MAG: CDP-alcohol phosphatidyltransferase family protein [Alphaproteobacteria bacterium]
MLDATLRKVIDPPLNVAGVRLARLGLSANALTLTGFGIGLAAIPALATENYAAALALILANRLMDGLDGAVARAAGGTDFGGFLDIVCDFIFYSGVVFGCALARPENALAAAFLIFSFTGTGASFLAFAAIAARKGITTEVRGAKAIYYLGGLTEGTETILVLCLFCVWPDGFAPVAWVFGALCWLTTASRFHSAWRSFG